MILVFYKASFVPIYHLDNSKKNTTGLINKFIKMKKIVDLSYRHSILHPILL